MGKRDYENFKKEFLINKRTPSFIKVRQFFWVGPYLRREFIHPTNVELDTDNQTISFDVENWATLTSIRLTKKISEIELINF